ncbi:hypothetical protein Hgul01_05392 [Herpetosiphon gulosus]|uniref:RHS repeat-associated core domain-containing protein n=2 Tax=Herpetosiphon gulosus TaxID=1973496 RepID=A0ABP9X851_9CHLR
MTSGYTHDANGNLTTTPDATYTYDAANRVTSSTTSAGTTTYGYDGWGNLVRVTTNGQVQDLVLDEAAGLPQVLGTVTANGTTRVARDPAGLLHQTSGGQVSTLLTDLVGSVRQGITPSGTTLFSQTFTVDGVPVAHSGSATSAFGFTGEWTNSLDGLVYLRARHYLPTMGRFIQRDTDAGSSLAPASLHRYAYVDNNPATWTDPTGHRKGLQPDGSWEGCQIILGNPEDQCTWQDYLDFFKSDSGDDFWTMVKQGVKRIERLPRDIVLGAVAAYNDPIGTLDAMRKAPGQLVQTCLQGTLCYNYEALGDCVFDLGGIAVGGGFGGAGVVDDFARIRPTRKKFDLGTAIGDWMDDPAVRNGMRVKPIPDYYDVVGHGLPDYMFGPDKQKLTAKQVADIIRAQPDYKGGSIRLISCHTGTCPTGFAQQLANEMNVQVLGAHGSVFVDELGTMTVSNPIIAIEGKKFIRKPGPGIWRVFFPSK